MLRSVLAASVLALVSAQAHAAEDSGRIMVEAITESCLAHLAEGVPVGAGLQPADAALTEALLPRGGGAVWRTPDPGVVVIVADTGFACQVLGEDVPRPAFSAALSDWLRGDGRGYRLAGNLPFGARDIRGLYLARQLDDGDYMQIEIVNAGDGRLSALATRAADNPVARRFLGR